MSVCKGKCHRFCLQIPKKFGEFAKRIGVEVDDYNFTKSYPFCPVETTRPGVYACGVLQEPKDIPSSVTDGSAAAYVAGGFLAGARNTLTKSVEKPEQIDVRVNRRRSRRAREFIVDTQVEYCDTIPRHRTMLKLQTADRPGLLATIGQVFAEQQIRVHAAKIATIGAEADDTFFITDNDNHPVQSDKRRSALQQALIARLDSPELIGH